MEIINKNGEDFAIMSKQHKQFVEKDFPIAVTKFRIGVIENMIKMEECLDNLKEADNEISKILDRLIHREDEMKEKFYEDNKDELDSIISNKALEEGAKDDDLPDYIEGYIIEHSYIALSELLK